MPTVDRITLATVVFSVAVLAVAHAAGRWDLAVYALSFWHYLFYILAYVWRRIPHDAFKRDSLLLKSISMAALAFVLVSTLPSLLSLAVMAAGFALNISAAAALGADRTYYGVEIGGMPVDRVESFPFSVVPHPMLTGNMIAYGALLLDDGIRQHWWPLALLHVLLNLLVLLNEAYSRKSWSAGVVWSAAGLGLGSAALFAGFMDVSQFAAVTVVMILAFGAVLLRRYATVEDPR